MVVGWEGSVPAADVPAQRTVRMKIDAPLTSERFLKDTIEPPMVFLSH
jgi:hypothetical protein